MQKNFRIAARDKDKKIKQQANNWIKYTENEEIRVANLALRRDYIQQKFYLIFSRTITLKSYSFSESFLCSIELVSSQLSKLISG